MKILFTVCFCMVASCLLAQQKATTAGTLNFFGDETLLEARLTTDMRKMINSKSHAEAYQPATFICHNADSSFFINKPIRISARGITRKQICFFPPLKLNFKDSASTGEKAIGALKMVCQCNPNDNYQELLIKEYLTYRIWNLLSEKSLRVRLMHIIYRDSEGKKKDFDQYAFLIEDIKALAKRTSCTEMKKVRMDTESTDRVHMTNVAIFQYMIGNTDWAVPVLHNIAIMHSKSDSAARPFAIPYDFDYSGLVNAEYAVPDANLDISNVQQRVYRGFPRTMQELHATLDIYRQQKEKIYTMINGFELLPSKKREEMINYLDDFYDTINSQHEIERVFIDGARIE